MMSDRKRAFLVVVTPEPQSTNARLATTAARSLTGSGWNVETLDLYATAFDPVEAPRHYATRVCGDHFDAQIEQRAACERGALPPDVATSVAHVETADLVVLQYPLWWFGMPAMLKGWLDRVFVYGGFYTSGRRYERGPMAGKRALLSITVGDSREAYAHDGLGADLAALLWPSLYTLRFVGFSVLRPVVAYGIHGGLNAGKADGAAVEARIRQVEAVLSTRLPQALDEAELPFNRWPDFGDDERLRPHAPVYSPFIRHRSDIGESAWPGAFAPQSEPG